jgi:outer membrane lipoprotein SlyB
MRIDYRSNQMRTFVLPAIIPIAIFGLVACAGVEKMTGREPIIDMAGVDPATLEQDMAECEAYADQVEVGRQTAVGAATGAAVGGVIGAVFGNGQTAARTATVGATTGGVSGASGALSERRQVIRNCLVGRGYRVLN